MKKKLLGIMTAFVMLVSVIPPVKAEAAASTTVTFEMTYGQTEAREMLDSINSFRTGSDAWAWDSSNTQKVYYNNLKPLTYDYGLERDAMQRAAEIAICYSHTRPNGERGLLYRTNPNGALGENIAAGYTSGSNVFVGWREDNEQYNGQGHRRNMLSENYKYVAIGHVYYCGYHYWVQEFGSEPADLSYSAPYNTLTKVKVEILDEKITASSCTTGATAFTLREGESVALPSSSCTLTVSGHWGSSNCTLPDNSAVWTSSDSNIAQINGSNVRAVNAGSATLYARAYSGGVPATCAVTVQKDESGGNRHLVWENINGKSYWYENNERQGTASDTKCFSYDGTLRGREIFDPSSDGWYWLDVNADGAKAVGKEVFMPYIYQNENSFSESDIKNNAAASGANADGNIEHAELAEQVEEAIRNGTGKWVRYDTNGKMLKGWVTIEGDLAYLYPHQSGNVYYYDRKTGLMAKGKTVIDGKNYYFDEITGVLK